MVTAYERRLIRRVHKAARWLDEDQGEGWILRVNRGFLDMTSGFWSLGEQLDMELPYVQARRLAFVLPEHLCGDAMRDRYALLTRLWLAEIDWRLTRMRTIPADLEHRCPCGHGTLRVVPDSASFDVDGTAMIDLQCDAAGCHIESCSAWAWLRIGWTQIEAKRALRLIATCVRASRG